MLHNHWYIACFVEELKTKKSISKKIVGKEILIFQTASNDIGILENRCCHRNVHLSLGEVKNDCIKCGYHGWEFNTKGECTHIPMLEDHLQIPSTAKVKHYPFAVKHQIIWVYLGDEQFINEAEIPDLSYLDHHPFVFNAHTLNAQIELVAESLFDAQHINHVHKNTINTLLGKLNEPKTDYTIDSSDKELHGTYERINVSNLFEKIYFGWSTKIQTEFSFWYPHTSRLASYFPKHLHFPARELIIFEHFYEIEENKVLMIQITAWKNIFRFNPWFAKWFMKQKSDKIVAEDIAFLESNLHWHQKEQLTDLIIKGDEPTLSFKKLWSKNFKNEKTN